MRNCVITVWGVVALCAAAIPAAAYDYPDPTGFDIHTADPRSNYYNDYPIFIHDVKVWDYTGSYPGPAGWTEGDYPWHERNLTNTRGMYPLWAGGEGPFYWHGDFRGAHYISDYGGGTGSWSYGPWLHEEVPSAGDPVYLEFYLGGLYAVNMMCVFNYTLNATQGQAWDDPAATYYKRGIQDVVIKYKTNQMDAWTTLGAYKFGVTPSGVGSSYGTHDVNNQFGPYNDPNDTPFARPVKFGDKLIRYAQFEILSNWGDAQFVGCNEIRFYAPGSAYLLKPPRIMPATTNHFGPVEVGGKAHQTFTVMNAGTEDSMMRLDVVDTSFLAGTVFTLQNPIAPGTDLTGALLIDGGISTASLGTFEFSPPDIGEYEGNILLQYTDARDAHQTTVTVQGAGRYGAWGSLWCKADAWHSYQTWDSVPSYGGWRMCDGTNMNDPAKGMSGSRKATVGRYDPATGVGAVWGWGHLSGYFGWYGWRHHWVCFDFGQNVTIDEMLVWNSPNTTGCAKDVIISYTTEDVKHHGEPQDEPNLGPSGYPSLYERQRDQWANAYGHFSGVNDTRWTPLAGTNRSGERTGAHRFAQVMSGDWNHAPEVIGFGGVTARQVRFDFLHDGTPGAWGHRTRAPGEWSLQGWDTTKATIPSGYGNWGNDWAIAISQVRFYSGGPYPELKADLPAATGDMLRSSTNPYDLKPFEFLQFYPFVTTSTALHIGNVGDAGTTVRIQEITFMDEDGDGTPDPGPFSVGLGSVALPKSYAAGTTEAVSLVWAPRRELATYDANVVVVADDGAGNINKAVIPIRANACVREAGWVPGEEITAESLYQYNATWNAAQLTVTGTNMAEKPDGLVGSKAAEQFQCGVWDGWCDNIEVSSGKPPLEEHWIEFDLGAAHDLDEMWLWNHGDVSRFGNYSRFGASDPDAAMKDTIIEYKESAGASWTRLGGASAVYTFYSWGDDLGDHPQWMPAANLVGTREPVRFDGARARYVRLSAAGGVGVGNYGNEDYWGCAEVRFYEPAPVLSVDVDTLDFGYVPAGAESTKSFVISNVGKKALNVDSINVEGSSAYTLSGATSFTVDTGTSRTVEVTYAPTSETDDWGTRIVVTHNASGAFYCLTANGSALAPATPTDLDLAPEDDTGCSDSDNITNMTTSLTISGAVESGTAASVVLLREGATLLTTGTLAPFRSPGLDVAPPEIALLAPRDPHPGQPESVDFTVAFDEGVTSFSEPSAVTVHHDGTAHTSVTIAPAPMSGGDSPATYTVTVSGVSGIGSMALSVNPGGAFDFAGNATLGGGPSAPVWIEPPSPTPTVTETPTPTEVPPPSPTPTLAPSETPLPTATPTPVAPPTATPTPAAPPEPIRALVTSFYNLLLAREPEAGAVDAWHHGYFDYAVSFNIDVRFIPREMGRLFFLSEEYAARNRTNAEFIADCYRVFLDRDPNDAELAAWLAGTWNRSQVMTVFSESVEFAARIAAMYPGLEGDPMRNFVTFMYIGLLDRLPDQAGLEYAAALFDAAKEQGGLGAIREQAKQMAREVIASEEFLSKDRATVDLVARFYRAFLGRFPNDVEMAFWTEQLGGGAETTDSVIVLFAESEEFTAALIVLANNGLAIGKGTTMTLSWSEEGQPDGSQGFHVFRSGSGIPGSYCKVNSAAVRGNRYEDANLEIGTYFYIIYLETASGRLVQWTPPFCGIIESPSPTPTPPPTPIPTVSTPTPSASPVVTPVPTASPTASATASPAATHTPSPPTPTPTPVVRPANWPASGIRALAAPGQVGQGEFGSGVGGVPDLSGDGRGDLLVGANSAPPDSLSAGLVCVIDGATGQFLRILRSPNPEPSGYFGRSVSHLSDTNGAAFARIVVGAHGERRAYVLDGATGQPVLTLVSPNARLGTFGISVSGVADVNGDGRGDIVVGAHEESSGGSPIEAGRAYVFDGGTGGLLHSLFSPFEEYRGRFGYSVAGIADVTDDGRGDIVVGTLRERRAYVFDGAKGRWLRTLVSPNDGNGFGSAVSGIPDVTGDGREDVIIGARGEQVGKIAEAGRAYVFDGATGELLHVLVSPYATEIGSKGEFGAAVSGIADLNGDGRGDVVVGAPSENLPSEPRSCGRAYIFDGATGRPLFSLVSPSKEEGGLFGAAVSGVPDVDGDGVGDAIVGAPYQGRRNEGRAYLFHGVARP